MQGESSRLSVLLVEDHDDTALLLGRLLTRVGYDVRVAKNCGAALAEARERRVDVLLCDLGLPDGDGCDLLREITALYPIRAIALTGYSYPYDAQRSRDAGFEKHVVKPFALNDVLDAIAGMQSPA